MLLYVQTVFLRYINILYRSHFPARSEENSETLPDLTSYPSKKRQPSPASFYRDVQSFHVKYYYWKAERSGTYDCRSTGVKITLITLIFSLFILHSGRNPPAKCSIALGLPMPRITWGAQSWRCVRLGAQRIQSMADNLNWKVWRVRTFPDLSYGRYMSYRLSGLIPHSYCSVSGDFLFVFVCLKKI